MSQAPSYSFPRNTGEAPVLSRTDGSTLLDQIIEALTSSNSGITAPSGAVAGMVWLDTSATPYRFRIYDGAQWRIAFRVDATTGTVTPFARAYVEANGINSGTAIPGGGTATKVQFLQVRDAENVYANGTYTVPETGVYDFRYGVFLPDAGGAGYASVVAIYVDGAVRQTGMQFGGSYVGSRQMNGSHYLSLDVGDLVEIYVTQTHTSSLTIAGADNGNNRWWFQARRVG